MKLTVTVTQEQIDAIESIVMDAQAWLQSAWDGKANACINRVINKETNLQANKLTSAEKITKIREIKPIKRKNREVIK